MRTIKKVLKENYKIISIYIIILSILYIPLPYRIYAPGGIVNVNKRVSVDKEYQAKGSFNLSYVMEYKGNLLTMLVSLFNKNWDIISKKDITIDNETIVDYNKRDKLMLKEAYQNATIVAYKKAKKDIEVKDYQIYVGLLLDESKTNLKVGDQIVSVEGKKITDLTSYKDILKKHHKNEKIKLKVINDGEEHERYAALIKYNNDVIVGSYIIELKTLKTNPVIEYKYAKDEYGSSGGLMLALTIYNSLTKQDITKGKTIVGTGTIDKDGNVGKIDGIEYKIKGAAKKHIDLFIVPKANLKEALKVKKDNHYKLKIIGVSTFEETLEYLRGN